MSVNLATSSVLLVTAVASFGTPVARPTEVPPEAVGPAECFADAEEEEEARLLSVL